MLDRLPARVSHDSDLLCGPRRMNLWYPLPQACAVSYNYALNCLYCEDPLMTEPSSLNRVVCISHVAIRKLIRIRTLSYVTSARRITVTPRRKQGVQLRSFVKLVEYSMMASSSDLSKILRQMELHHMIAYLFKPLPICENN